MKKFFTAILTIFSVGFMMLAISQSVKADDVVVENNYDLGVVVAPSNDFVPIIGTIQKENVSRGLMRASGTGPTIVTYGPFTNNVKGSQLNSWAAKSLPATQNLDAASRRAVLAKYGKINTGKTYAIRWYNRVETRVTSVNGMIVNVSCIN